MNHSQLVSMGSIGFVSTVPQAPIPGRPPGDTRFPEAKSAPEARCTPAELTAK